MTGLADEKVMVVDFGSTFTKVGIFDTKDETFSLKYVPTTVDDHPRWPGRRIGCFGRVQGEWRLETPGEK